MRFKEIANLQEWLKGGEETDQVDGAEVATARVQEVSIEPVGFLPSTEGFYLNLYRTSITSGSVAKYS